jgi:hypothetical protein
MKNAPRKSNRGGARPGAGRPATGHEHVVGARLSVSMIEEIDAWAKAMGVTRSDAIRSLLRQALSQAPR